MWLRQKTNYHLSKKILATKTKEENYVKKKIEISVKSN